MHNAIIRPEVIKLKESTNGVFAERLKLLRAQRNVSQAQLAKKLNISQSAVAGWEILKAEPGHATLTKVADIFGVSLDYLLGRTDNPLTTVSVNTPYEQVTPFERRLLDVYRRATEGEQVAVCRVLGLEHPAEARLRAKRA